jgi:transcriptional regulator with XRE-family HTH domain
MIKNERQYRITNAEAEKFERALAELDASMRQPSDVHPLLRKAERDALASQLGDLLAQLREYEALKEGRQAVLQVNSLDELPRALVQARIAAGLSQKDLAARMGLKEQQVQRYEAREYAGANLCRLQEVCKALGVNIHKDLFLPTVAAAPERVFERFKEIGLDKEFVMKRFVPFAVAERAKTNPEKEAANMIFHATNVASYIYGWTPAAILGTGTLRLDTRAVAAARFKVISRAKERKLSAYTVYAHFLALQLLQTASDFPCNPIPTEASEVRAAVINVYGSVSFEAVLRYVWSLGVPVLPLNDPGAFHGACWRVNGRNVIVLKQRTRAIARWLHDLLHELRHAGEQPNNPEHSVIEAAETSPERRESEEVDATQFAADVALDGRAEELVQMCVQAIKGPKGPGRLELLKSVLPKVAARERVKADSLANYMAFRLSLQEENWWGAAMNLQRTDEDPWRIARDILLQHASLARITGMDRDLLIQALSDREDH